MEQAVNTFQHGLQMDTHPMNHGNDSLTDALNATLATMNGNEAILQNDMGNAKVDNAYLPAGYVPVGIKEHGGIIYVASYNPITNRSQLGSFPSPERKYNNKDLNINQEIKLKDLEASESVSFCNSSYNCLKTDERIYNLTEKNIIRTGDKFALWFDGNFDDLEKLSNRNNTNSDNGKVTSPKNKLYTLSVGVINSQNEFVDITKTLGRWNGNKLVKYTNETDLYKFNDHYFIAGGQPNDATSPAVPKKDRELLKERQVKELNTYTYKLLGPLCIKTKLNHVESFSYNIYGLRTDDNKAELWIEGYVTYNCPDGINSGGGSDDNYINYCDDSQLSNCFFDFKVDGQNKGVLLTGNDYKTKYDPTTNLYTVKQVLHVEPITGNNNKIDYFIGVKPCLDNELNGIYLRDLSNCGTIDISKLGSGTYELKEWRFTSNLTTKTSTLVYTIEAYPKYGEKLDHLEVTFRNVDINPEEDIYCRLPLNNGTTQITFSWRDPQMFSGDATYILDRALYSVSEFNAICLTSEGTIRNNDVKQKNEEENLVDALEFFLTTERMNSCFNPRNEDFIRDYGFPRTNSEIETFQKKQKIELITNVNLDDQSEYKVIDKKTNIISTSSNLSLEYTSEANINIINKSTISIKDLERLYPSYIALSPDADSESVFDLENSYLLNKNLLGQITINKIGGNLSLGLSELAGHINGWSDPKISIDPHQGDQAFENSTDKSIQAIFEYKDIYKSIGISNSDTVISNGFVTLTKTNFKKWFDEDNENNYGGVCYGTVGQTGHDDIHEVRLSYGPNVTDPAVTWNQNSLYTVVTSRYEDDWIVFTDKHSKKVKDGESEYIELVADDYESKIYETMNQKADRELFLFRFFNTYNSENSPQSGKKDQLNFTNKNPLVITRDGFGEENYNKYKAVDYARLWWRNSDTWSLIKFVINKTTDYNPKADKSKSGIIYDFLLKCGIISQDLVYAMYKFITAEDAGIYIPDFNNQIYNNFYEITFPFEGFITINNTQNCIKLLKKLTDKDIDKIGQIKNIKSYSNYAEYGKVELNNNTFYFQNPEKNDCKVEFYIETTVKSSREFQDIIDTLKGRVQNLSNIYLETGQTLDADGNQLHSRNLYNRHTDIKGNVYLVRYNFSNFQITEDFGREGIQVIIPNIRKGIPELRYDIYNKQGGGADRKTILDYANFNIVDSPILTPGKNS